MCLGDGYGWRVDLKRISENILVLLDKDVRVGRVLIVRLDFFGSLMLDMLGYISLRRKIRKGRDWVGIMVVRKENE